MVKLGCWSSSCWPCRFDHGLRRVKKWNATQSHIVERWHTGRISLHVAITAKGLTVIIDVFRAFTTACHVAARHPRTYHLFTSSAAAPPLRGLDPAPLLIGKAELGVDLGYDIPNSPALSATVAVEDRVVLHRSGAGAKGVLAATQADEVITGSFVNAAAVVRYIRSRAPEKVTLVPMGHEAGTPSPEDDLCARCIAALLDGQDFDLAPHREALRASSGRYFFEGAAEYPPEDFELCLERDRFDFVLRAELLGDHARLTRIDVP